MSKQKDFNDPLEDLDPIMEQAFSVSEESDSNTTQKTEEPTEEVSSPTVSTVEFPNLDAPSHGDSLDNDVFREIPVKVSVELGRSSISLKEEFELTEGSIIELERLVGEPLDLVVNGQVIAQGEVVAIDNNGDLVLKTKSDENKIIKSGMVQKMDINK